MSCEKKVVLERYEISTLIGEGGMGAVYKGFDPVLEKFVAIKTVRSGALASDLVRFQQEAQAIAKLQHPNILKVMDFASDADGMLYLVMEYVDGNSLDDFLDAEPDLSILSKLEIFLALVDGLEHAHRNGILHRDVKPSNVMIRRVLSDSSSGDTEQILCSSTISSIEKNSLEVKLVDFGLAKRQELDLALTESGIALGSPLYMSPEQARGSESDERSDIYSFACLMFRTLAGRPPFESDNLVSLAMLHASAPAPSVLDFSPECPEDLAMILSKCLEKDSVDRFQSCAELREALEQSLASLEVRIASSELAERKKQEESSKQRLELIFSNMVFSPLDVWEARPLILLALCLTAFIASAYKIASNLTDNRKESAENTISHFGKNPKAGAFDTVSEKDLDMFEPWDTGRFQYTEKFGHIFLVADQSTKDEDLALLEQQPKSFRLNLANLDITGTGFKYLANSKLTVLVVENCSIADSSLALIADIPELSDLVMNNCSSLTASGLSKLSSCRNLQSLEIHSSVMSESLLSAFSSMPGLSALSMGGIKDSDAPSLRVCKLPSSLRKLMLNDWHIASSFGRNLSQVPDLNSLAIRRCRLDDNLDFLSRLKKLEQLEFKNVSLKETVLKTIARCKGLRKLELTNCDHLSESQLYRLKAALPQCRIIVDPDALELN